jgi:hypothetical protein
MLAVHALVKLSAYRGRLAPLMPGVSAGTVQTLKRELVPQEMALRLVEVTHLYLLAEFQTCSVPK